MKHTDQRLLPLAALVLSALLATGCGNGGGTGTQDGESTAPAETSAPAEDGATAEATAGGSATATPSETGGDASATATPSETGGDASASATPSGTASPSGSTTATGGAQAIAAVLSTAEDAVDGGRAVEIERRGDGSGWETTVVSGDAEHEVVVSPDGADVVSQREDDRLDAADRAELDQASVPLPDAVETALGEVEGELESASLDEENGVLVWDVEVREATSGDSQDVSVSAEDGTVIGVDR